MYNMYIYIYYSTFIYYINNVFHELNSHMDENWGYHEKSPSPSSREINPGVGELQFQCSGHLRRHLSRKRVDPKGKSTGDPCEIPWVIPKKC